ncbi:hypothetical protein [Labilibaculum manganireducens]|uniref:hypothetical protein n=1 Tax=Labilibaculum manganireducens TaxID=1940525 RepID=UPI0029F50E86|nr:hypothetical protein [Labilibaculum manganireducens]
MKTDTLNKEAIEMRTNMIPEIKTSYGNYSELWRTSISDITVLGAGELTCRITRPNSGSAKGGYLYIYKDKIEGTPLVRQYFAGQASGIVTIMSNQIDLFNGHYVLAYGPHFTDQVNIIAATVQLDNGYAYNQESSVCTPIQASINQVTSHYIFASNSLGFSHYDSTVILREGNVFGEGNEVARAYISKESNRIGTNVMHANLKHKQAYNVSINIYSSVRPVAGYTFTLE